MLAGDSPQTLDVRFVVDEEETVDTHRFIRGDCNGDGLAIGGVTDAVFLLGYLFLGGRTPGCMAACDVDGDGRVVGGVNDPVYLLNYLFLGRAAPPAPHPGCGAGRDSDAALGCDKTAERCR